MAARSPSTAKSANPAQQVDAYLKAAPAGARQRLRQMRTLIRTVAPDAEESFSYRMPAFKLDGRAFVWYAAFTSHTSLFPIGAAIRKKYAAQLKGFGTSTGTVRFPLDEPLPARLVKQLVKARAAEVRRT